MPDRDVAGGPRAAWLTCLLALGACAASVLVPQLRDEVAVVGPVTSMLLVLVGVARHRPASRVWLVLVVMLALWAMSHVSVHLAGAVTAPAVALIGAGQAIAAGVVARVVWVGRRRGPREPGNGVDVVIITAVLTLVVGQLAAAAAAGGGTSWLALVVPTVDVTIIGMLLRMVVTARGLPTSTYLLLAAAGTTLVYDLTNAVTGQRLALPGQPTQALGALCVMLFAVAALHPTMVTAFDPRTFTRRRPPSTALLGLLPLVLVPVAVWWVAQATGAPGLATWVLLMAEAVVAGLCLLRAAIALRGSEYLANHDPLTGLANRRGLERAHANQPPAGGRSMLLIDVDEFKQVNDTHGHDTGDALLLHLRDRLTVPRVGVERVARLGGDEFVLLVATPHARSVAEQLLVSLRAPVRIDDLELRVSASIGIADAADAMTLSELITHADVAMYGAKTGGRNTVATFHPDMRAKVTSRFLLTSQVRQLLGRLPDVGNLEIHYQPVVELRTEQHVAVEALVRWRHPEHGLLTPDAFLSLVATSGLDARLDEEVLGAVLRQIGDWQRRGLLHPPVSVNLTSDTLADPALARHVLAALRDADVQPGWLRLEITEHHQLPDDSPAVHTLAVLAAAGVGIYLDDYGVGYTSLDYLSRFPVSILKLDRSLIAGLGEGRAPLVAGVAAMADTLDLQLLAEGIETTAQRDRLIDLGVRYGQGYLFSKPLPADQYTQILSTALQPSGRPA